MKNVLKKGIAFTLALTLSVSSANVSLFITKANQQAEEKSNVENSNFTVNSETVKPKVVEEVMSDRTTDSTTFLLSNGMKQTTYYSDDIYFENEKGKLAEYDNEFVKLDKNDKKQVVNSVEVSGSEKEEYSYVNNEGDSKQFLPNKLSEKTPVVMTKENYVVSFAPTDVTDEGEEGTEENALSAKTKKISLDSKTVTNVYDGSREEKKIVANYEGKNESTELSYESLEYGLKETITLNNKPESNIISFNFTLQDSYAKVDEVGGGITIYSDDDDIVGGIEAPFMNDATKNNYSEELHYELAEVSEKESNVHKYILKLVVDENYLENASYPVVIDPTVTWNGTGDLPEAYVLKSAASTNYFGSGVKTFSVGKGSQGVFRTYFRAMKLANTVKNKYIDSATLTVYENGDSVSGSTIYVKPVANSFKCGTVNWNNQPGGTSATLASFKSKGKKNAKHEINLKTWAQNVSKGSGGGNKCYGLLFKASSESASSYVRFYGARAASYVPKLKVVYYDAPATATSVKAVSASNTARTFIAGGELLNVSWSGVSAHALSYVQYRIENSSGTDVVGYSESTHIGTTASGSKNINISSLTDGTYKIYVRGADKAGIKGTGKGATFVVDKTKPVFSSAIISSSSANNYKSEAPSVSWKVTEKNLSAIQFSVNGSAYKYLSNQNSGSEEIDSLVSGSANAIKIRAVDKAGNISDVKSFTYYYDEDEPVISAAISPNTNSEKMDNSGKNPILKYTISDKTLKSYEIELNDEKINVSGSSGEVELKNVEEGENDIYITAIDKAGNDSEQELSYYKDTVVPKKGTVRITPKTGFFNSSNQIPIVKWDGITDDNLLCVQVKIDDGEYKELGKTSKGEGQLQSADFKKNGKYKITIRGIDKAGNVSEEISSNYYYDAADYALEDYTPINVYATEQIGGNTILRFATKNEKYRDDVKYQVYRSTTPNVVISEKTFVKSYSSKGSIRISGDENVTYYYKLRTVKKTGTETLYSDYSDEISSTTIGMDEKNKRLGTNTMCAYSAISTPNGSGQVELSKGNFYYEQNDISLPAVEIPVNISRVYNSNSSQKSIFGYGWSNEYDAYVSECGDKIYYTDGTRAVYTFNKKNNEYICVENPDLSLEIDDDVLTRKIESSEVKATEIEADIHFNITDKNGEIYRFDDAGRLVLIEETNGSFVYITYDEEKGSIKSVITNRGQQAKFEYNSNGLVSKITAGNNDYGYSYTYENNHLTKATYIGTDGKSIDYKYAYTDDVLTSIIDAEGNEYRIAYKNGCIEKFKNPMGEYIIYDFDNNEQLTKLTSYIGNAEDKKLGTDTYRFNINGQLLEKIDSLGNILNYTYDSSNKALLTGEREESSYYALENGIVTKKKASSKKTTEYNSNGNVILEKDDLDNVTTYEYSDVRNGCTQNQPTKIVTKDASGKVILNQIYSYDEKGNILIEKDLIENTIGIYKYNADGTVSESKEYLVEDANKLEEREGENIDKSLKKELKVCDESTEYNDLGDEVGENSTEGTVKENVSYEYDNYGNVIKETDNTSGTIIEYKYDGFFRTIETKETLNEKGKTTTKITKSKFDKNGSVVQSTDELGRITDSVYDSLNRVITTTLKVGKDSKTTKMSYTYEDVSINKGIKHELIRNAAVKSVYNDKGEITNQSFTDLNGRTVKELSNGLYIDYIYDESGKVLATYTSGVEQDEVDCIAEGIFVVNTYDEKGNQTATITNPEITVDAYKVGKDSIVTTNEYDKNGNLIKSTDGEGNQTKYEYDEQGRTTKVITPSDATNKYSHDELTKDGNGRGVVDTVTDALGRVSKTTNNGSDQITKIEDIASTKSIVKTYEYDSNGRQTKEIYSDGSYIQNTYEDATGELIKSTRIDDSGNVEGYTQYEYTVDDKVKSAIDYKSGKPYRYTYYEYDAYGRNTGVAEINATSTPTTEKIKDSMIKYVYDVDDNIIKIYYPNSSKDKLKGIKFIYNKDKWITEIDGILSGGDDDTTVIRKYDYYSNAKVRTIRDYKNFINKGTDYIQRDYSYDKIDRVVSMIYSTSDNPNIVKEKYEYKYDKNSNITYKHELSNYEDSRKDEEVFYAYDEEGRLVKSEKNNKLTYKTVRCTYKYDKVGNRTYESEFETDTVATDQSKTTGYYSYNGYNELNQLTSSTVIECADGSNVKSYSKSYNYDNKGNQISVTDSGKKTNTTYKYDVNSQLIDVETKTNGVITSKQHNEYNGQGQRILKTDTQIEGNKVNSKTINYYYEGSLLLYTTDEKGNKTSQNIIGNDSNAFATIRYDSGTQTEYFYSKDVQGSVVAILNNSGKCEQAYSYTDYGETQKNIDSKFYNEICYTGGIYDENTGLYYLNARYYDTRSGAFLSQDTYRENNMYNYCGGNPISYTDPSGHSAVVVSGGVYSIYKKNSGKYYYEFIETALLQLKDWSKYKCNKYWLIADNGWTKKDKSSFKKNAKKYSNVRIKYFKSSSKLIKILNKPTFKKDKITDFTVFSHGLVGKLALGYDYSYDSSKSNKLDFKIKHISKVKKSSFNYPRSIFYACNIATNTSAGKNFAKRWSKRFWSTTTAYKGKTDYADIRNTTWLDYIADLGIRPARNYPVACPDAKKKTYKKEVIRPTR